MVIDHSQYRFDQVRIQWDLGSSTKELEPGQRDQDAYTRMTLRRILQPRYMIFEAEDESEARTVHTYTAGDHFSPLTAPEARVSVADLLP